METSTATEPDRVLRHTSAQTKEQIDEATRENVRRHASESPVAVGDRIHQLERQWDIEQTLETNASVLALTGTVLGVAVDKRWFALPAAVLGFLAQHAIMGWCPPVPVFRRLGVRTQAEIDQEKYALKALRGDFAGLGRHSSAAEILNAVRS